MSITVTRETFVRAETDRDVAALLADAGGLDRWHHQRDVASVDHQTVIRLDRDRMTAGPVDPGHTGPPPTSDAGGAAR